LEPDAISRMIRQRKSVAFGGNLKKKKVRRRPWQLLTNVRGRKHQPYTESPNSLKSKKARKEKRKVKSVLTTFFYIREIVHKEFLQAGQSIPHTTVTFYGDCVKMCEDFAPNFGDQRNGCCMTTRQHLTLHSMKRYIETCRKTLIVCKA
jgi:hypothetical protein